MCLTFNILCHQWPSVRQRAIRVYYELLRKILFYEQSFWITNRFWEWLHLNLRILCRIKIRRYIRLYRRHSFYDKKKPSNLHKNSLFLRRCLISNLIVMENYKWWFKKQFLSLVKHKCRPNVWQDTKVLWSEPSF